MATGLVSELIVVILWLSYCRENCGLQCWRRCSSVLKQKRSKCRIVCADKQRRSERAVRSGQSTTNATTVKSIFTTGQPTVKQHGCDYIHEDVVDDIYGLSNPQASNLRVQYSRHKNKTIARVAWDLPKECLKRDFVCRGYFVQWAYAPSYYENHCHLINNINRKYFLLDETTGFDGKQRFGVNVIGIPSKNSGMRIQFNLKPPAPDNLTTPQIVFVPTPSSPGSKRSPDPSTHAKIPSSTIYSTANLSLNTDFLRNNNSEEFSEQPQTILISSVTLFVLFVFAILLATRWLYRKHKEEKYETPNHRPIYKKVIKGKHYISYLPESETISQVFKVCSWLASHDIDVVMDRMYDPKLYNSLGPKRFGETFVTKAEKVIMIITPGYLKLCWLDDAVDINSKPTLNSLDKERLYSEVRYIKNELSTSLCHTRNRFIPVLVNVPEHHLPKWLSKMTTVSWPKDGRSDRFLKFLKGDCSAFEEYV